MRLQRYTSLILFMFVCLAVPWCYPFREEIARHRLEFVGYIVGMTLGHTTLIWLGIYPHVYGGLGLALVTFLWLRGYDSTTNPENFNITLTHPDPLRGFNWHVLQPNLTSYTVPIDWCDIKNTPTLFSPRQHRHQ